MMTLLGATLIASLLGSLHCAGMCGAFVAFAVGSGAPSESTGRIWPRHVAYHGGRLATYSLLGAAAGLVGATLNRGGSLVGVQRLAAVIAGSLLVVFGIAATSRLLGARLPRGLAPGFLGRVLRRGRDIALGWSPTGRAAAIGMLSTFLPCGWLWAFALAAAGTGHAAWGAATMAAFWVGTVPVLVVVGVGIQSLTSRTRVRFQAAASLMIVALGIATIAGRWDLPIAAGGGTAAPSSVEEAVEHVQGLDEEDLPCCRQNDP